MTDGGGIDAGGGERSPWERGAAPERGVAGPSSRGSGPVESEWSPVAASDTAIRFDEPSDFDVPPDDDPDWDDARRRRRRIAIGALAGALAFGVGASLVLPTDDPAAPDDPVDSTPQPTATTESLDDESAVDDDDSALADAEDALDEIVVGQAGGDRSLPTAAPSLVSIRVPAELAAIADPTEIVALDAEGRLVTVSLPSGHLRAEPIADGEPLGGVGFGTSALVVAPESAAARTSRTDITVIRRAGGSTTVSFADLLPDTTAGGFDLGLLGWVRTVDDSEAYLVAVYDYTDGSATTLLLAPDGSITELETELLGSPFRGVTAFTDGAAYVQDGGRVFEWSVDGTRRSVATGSLLGPGVGGPIVRTCAEDGVCSTRVVAEPDGDSPALANPTISELFAGSFGSIEPSPDGASIAVAGRLVGADDGDVGLTIARLDDPEAANRVAATGQFGHPEFGWLADGSGIVASAGNGLLPESAEGFTYVPVEPDGETIEFGSELGFVVALGVRHPDEELPLPTAVESRRVAVPPAAVALDPVVVATRSGRVLRIDFANGEITEWLSPFTPTWTNGRPAQVIPRDRTVAVVDESGADLLHLEGDDIIAPPVWPEGPRYPHNLKLIWGPVEDPAGGGEPTYELVDHQSIARIQTPRPIPASSVLGSDGVGGLVHVVAGDVWVTTGDESERITTGELAAISPTAALVEECGADLTCSLAIVARVSGERADVGPAARLTVGAGPRRSVTLQGSLSPDARWALVEVDDAVDAGIDSDWAFVDLVDSTIVGTDAPDDHQPVVWSADSTVALFVTDSRLHLFDSSTGTIEELGVLAGAGPVAAVGPAAGPVPDLTADPDADPDADADADA